ncbi:MAG: type II toxin-antitoxin system VapC family toxin [Phycisphaerae bacterium]|nr:type II toxin-antitoxin system VapC family toxin [Phycisphaerae bacterium]NUQ46737.1 type II toxin-antitoxin system VapC family toxin [Phycisphaerae bacterium]
MKPLRVYADTSVYGGVLDDEFAEASHTFFDQVRGGRFILAVSAVVGDELEGAPEEVGRLFDEMRRTAVALEVSEEVLRLQRAYLDASIVGTRWETDALHVALAVVGQCRLIVSWNFKHIVNFQKIPLYNGVSQALGHGVIGIHTPQEVIVYEDEDV